MVALSRDDAHSRPPFTEPGCHKRRNVESYMTQSSERDSDLRFVFGDTVMSFVISAHATFGEVARALDDVSVLRHGHPLCIHVMLRGQRHLPKVE